MTDNTANNFIERLLSESRAVGMPSMADNGREALCLLVHTTSLSTLPFVCPLTMFDSMIVEGLLRLSMKGYQHESNSAAYPMQ